MLISLNENDPTPIYVQIVRQIKEQILVGELRADDELPSVRELGDSLGISLHTARSAYQALSDEGMVRVRLGRKARIAPPRAAREMIAPDDVARVLGDRVRDVVVDARLLGLDGSAIHGMVDRELDLLAARRRDTDRPGSGGED